MKQLAVFLFVCLTWVFFRAESLDDATLILRNMFSGRWEDPGCPLLMLFLIALVWVYQWVEESRYRFVLQQSWFKVPVAIAMIVYLTLGASSGGEFIYFQF